MSMLRAAPAGDGAVLVAQCNVTIRVLAGCRVVGRITDAGIGSDRDDVLNRGGGLVPLLDFAGQIFPVARPTPRRNPARQAVLAIPGRHQAHESTPDGADGCDW